MLRHQQLFVAMEQRIDSGIDMLDGYNATLESYEHAIGLLGRLEAGDTSAVIDAQARFGHEQVVETVSNEAVVYHVNSAQIQAVIDFIKKYLPILLRKLKEFAKQFFDWVQVQAKRVEARAEKLFEMISEMTTSECSIEKGRTAAATVAFGMLADNKTAQFTFASPDKLGNASEHFARVAASGDRVLSSGMAMGNLTDGLRGWVGFNCDIPSLTFDATTVAGSPDKALRLLNEFPSAEEVWQTAVKSMETAKSTVVMSKEDIKLAVKVLRDAADRMRKSIEEARKTISQSQRILEGVKVPENSSVADQIGAKVKFGVRGATMCESALSTGFRHRLAVLDAMLLMLNRSLDKKVEAQ